MLSKSEKRYNAKGVLMNHVEVAILVKGAQSNDKECQLKLIEGFRPLILTMIRRYIYSPDTFEDYLNEGALILLKSLVSYQEDLGIPFPGYLKKELFYYFVNISKNQPFIASLNASLYNREATLLDSLKDELIDIEGSFVHQEDLKALMKHLPKLRKRQQWIIMEHYFKGESFNTIAKNTGVTSNSLVKLHRRVIDDLRKHFGLNLPN